MTDPTPPHDPATPPGPATPPAAGAPPQPTAQHTADPQPNTEESAGTTVSGHAEPPPEAAPPHSNEPPSEIGAPPPAALPPRRDLLPFLSGLGFLILALAIGLSYQFPRHISGATSTDVSDLTQQVQDLSTRETQLEHRPAPTGGADLTALTARVATLEQRPQIDLAPLAARLAQLEAKSADLAPLTARSDALSARLESLAARVEALSGRDQGADADLARRLDALEASIASLERNAQQLSAQAANAERLTRIQAAQTALAAGAPLGDLPHAPPAVAHFARAAPPTEAALHVAFLRTEPAALAASQPTAEGTPFLNRLLVRAESLVTIRQGDHVLVGDTAAGVLARAQAALDAGDLAGAVAAVGTLSGPPADAMASWLADAKAVLAARAGLADMAAHG
jgi:hypothetical protein